jgi:hypothetical protein
VDDDVDVDQHPVAATTPHQTRSLSLGLPETSRLQRAIRLAQDLLSREPSSVFSSLGQEGPMEEGSEIGAETSLDDVSDLSSLFPLSSSSSSDVRRRIPPSGLPSASPVDGQAPLHSFLRRYLGFSGVTSASKFVNMMMSRAVRTSDDDVIVCVYV